MINKIRTDLPFYKELRQIKPDNTALTTNNDDNINASRAQKTLYSEKEWDALIRLPRKEFLLEDKKEALLQLTDILFAFA